MRTLKRNQRSFWYCRYGSEVGVVDENGNETGERIVVYSDPVEMSANISQATGQSNTEQFGNLDNYDKVIVPDWPTDKLGEFPIDENSVLFVDKEPEFSDAMTVDFQESETLFGNDIATPVYVQVPIYDYVVRRVAKSLNSVSIAISKVKVS